MILPIKMSVLETFTGMVSISSLLSILLSMATATLAAEYQTMILYLVSNFFNLFLSISSLKLFF